MSTDDLETALAPEDGRWQFDSNVAEAFDDIPSGGLGTAWGMDKASWLSGFVDGEGCFYAGLHKAPKGSVSPKYLVVSFVVTLRADDEAALAVAREVLPVGRVHRRRATWTNSKPIVRWEVSNLPDLQRVVAHFDEWPLLTKKARDFAIWRELVALKASHPPGCSMSAYRAQPERVETLVAALRMVRVYEEAA